jgi:glutaminase
MKELKRKYQEAKAKAKKLMSDGRLSEYIAQLVTVEQLKLQLMNVSVSNHNR